MGTTRREFLVQLGAAAALGSAPLDPSMLAASPSAPSRGVSARSAPPYDLVITGGRVVDPARGPAGVADVAIKDGLIDLVAPSIPRAQARATYDASGKIVTPGLI